MLTQHFYPDTNVASGLKLPDFKDMLDNLRAEDAIAFLAHLRKIWVDSADSWARYGTLPPCTYYDFLVRTFLSMERCLLFQDYAAIERACFVFTIFVQTKIGTHKIADPHRSGLPIDSEGHPDMTDCNRQIAKSDKLLNKGCPLMSFTVGHDYATEDSDDRDWYWNTAAAWREAWHGFSHECAPNAAECTLCPHKRVLSMLKPLLRQAHNETRKLCRIATGRRLPVELVDVIHEYLLIAEEIPVDKTIAAPAKTTDGKDIHWDSDSSCDEDDSDHDRNAEDDQESVDRKPVLHALYRRRCLKGHDTYRDWDDEDAA